MDHFLSLEPTSLTVDLIEQHLLAGETSGAAVGVSRGTPRTPFFEGCSPSPLAPSYTSAAAVDVLSTEDVGAASSSAKRRSSKGKGGRGGGGGSGSGGGGSSEGSGGSGDVGSAGSGGGSGGIGSGGEGNSGSGGSGCGGGRTGAQRGGSGGGQRQRQQHRSETPSPQQLREWLFQCGASGGSVSCPYVICTGDRIDTAALGASESILPCTTPAEALHTFTLDSGASRFLSGSLSGLHLPSFSTNLVSTAALLDAMVTTSTPGGQRVSICTCTRTGRHLATFTRWPGSSLYTLATEPPQVAASAQVSASSQVAPPCSCCLLLHHTLMWHHRLGHPSLPRLHGMHSRLLNSGLPRSLPPLPPSPAPPCLPSVEGQQRAAPHSSSFPPTTAPLQTLHMDVWGPARVRGQGRERYFLLVADDYMRGGEFSSDLLRDFCHGEGILLPVGVESGGAEPEGVETGGAESEGAESGGAEPQGAASSGGPAAAGAGGTGVTIGAGGTGGNAATAGDPTEPAAARARGSGAGGSRAGGAGVGDTCAGGAGAGGTSAGGAGAGGARAIDPGGTVRPRTYFVPLLQQVLGVLSSTSLTPPLLCPPPDQSQPPLQPACPLPAPSSYTEQSGGLTERREPVSRPLLPVRTARCVPRSRPPPFPGTHAMALRPSSVPTRVPMPAPLESSLPTVPDPASDRVHATSPNVPCLLATSVTDPSFESAAASALVAELLDFAAACRLHYATALFAESLSASPPSVGGECALGTDVLEDRQEDFECLAAAVPRFASMLLAPEGDPDAPDIPTPCFYTEVITGPYSSQWQAVVDAEMASWKSTRTYVDEVTPPGANIVDGMWIFKGDYELHSLDFSTAFLQGSVHEEIWLRRPPGFTGSFCCRFGPSTADPSLFLRTVTSLPLFYVRVYVDDLVFATADAEALTLVNSELQKRHTCTDLGELRSYLGLQITRDKTRRTITLIQSHMVHQVLQRFGFQFSLPQPTPLSTGHPLSAPPSDESVERSGPYPELVGCLMYMMTTSGMGLVLGGWGPVVLTGHADASWVDDSATQRSSQGYTFSLGSGSVSWRSTRSSSVLSSNCEAEIYVRAMAAQELRWLTFLLTDLGEQPRSPPVLYVDNKAMIALC
ncbi:unnamed protein product [Closterium sp. NIES-53]